MSHCNIPGNCHFVFPGKKTWISSSVLVKSVDCLTPKLTGTQKHTGFGLPWCIAKKQRKTYFPNGWCTNFRKKQQTTNNKLKQHHVSKKMIWLRVPLAFLVRFLNRKILWRLWVLDDFLIFGFCEVTRSWFEIQETHLAIANFHLISEWIVLFFWERCNIPKT